MKASGVYYYLTDNSARAVGGSQSLNVVIPMMTQKGALGACPASGESGRTIMVTAETLSRMVGYDLNYNPRMYGVMSALTKMASLNIFRMNKNARTGNTYFSARDRKWKSMSDVSSVSEVKNIDGNLVWAAMSSPGKWNNPYIKFDLDAPIVRDEAQFNTFGKKMSDAKSVYLGSPALYDHGVSVLAPFHDSPLCPQSKRIRVFDNIAIKAVGYEPTYDANKTNTYYFAIGEDVFTAPTVSADDNPYQYLWAKYAAFNGWNLLYMWTDAAIAANGYTIMSNAAPVVVGVCNIGTGQGNFSVVLFDPRGDYVQTIYDENGDATTVYGPYSGYTKLADVNSSGGKVDLLWWGHSSSMDPSDVVSSTWTNTDGPLTLAFNSYADSSYVPPEEINFDMPADIAPAQVSEVVNFPVAEQGLFEPIMFDSQGRAITLTGDFHGIQVFKNVVGYADAPVGLTVADATTVTFGTENNALRIGAVPYVFDESRDGVSWGLDPETNEYGWVPDYSVQAEMRDLVGPGVYPLLWYPENVYRDSAYVNGQMKADAGEDDVPYLADGHKFGSPTAPYTIGVVRFDDYDNSPVTNYTAYLFPIGRWQLAGCNSDAAYDAAAPVVNPITISQGSLQLKAYSVDMPDAKYYVSHYSESSGVYSRIDWDNNIEDGAPGCLIDFFDKKSAFYYKRYEGEDTPLVDVCLGFPRDSFPDSPIDASNYIYGKYINLPNGSVGREPAVGEVTGMSALDDVGDLDIIALNGITDISMVNLFAQKCATMQVSLFEDAPDFKKYRALETWAKSLYHTEYASLHAVPDRVPITDTLTVYVWPSINMLLIYANMFSLYGHLNYPPAGYTYGNISVTDLLPTDYQLYADEIKTNKINYQKIGSLGPVMWENRTLYATESDLSYIPTVFILRALKRRLLEFFAQFSFRFTTSASLLTMSTGLQTILSSMQSAGFLVGFSYKVPSYAEAQAAGRELDIDIAVSVISDTEVINLRVSLENAANLGA